MTHQTLQKGQHLTNQITAWKTTCNLAFNHGLGMVNIHNPDGLQHMLNISKILTAEQHDIIRKLLADIATEQINKLQKEFDEL